MNVVCVSRIENITIKLSSTAISSECGEIFLIKSTRPNNDHVEIVLKFLKITLRIMPNGFMKRN